jgi:hypothetical protein
VNRTINGDTTSNKAHTNSLHAGLNVMSDHPLGLGLGTSPDIGDRFNVTNTVTSENYYLQVGDTVGVFNLALFVALMLVLIVEAQRAIIPGPEGALSGAAAGALVGLSVSAFFLHAWASSEMAWILWSAAGASLGVATAEHQRGVPPYPGRLVGSPTG